MTQPLTPRTRPRGPHVAMAAALLCLACALPARSMPEAAQPPATTPAASPATVPAAAPAAIALPPLATARTPLPPAASATGVKFSLIKTAETPTREALTWDGGSWSKRVLATHVAVLVSHPQGRFLLDTGLGSQTDRHFEDEMPWWTKPLMQYRKLQPARAQLDARGEPPIGRIVVTHGHWDHVAALLDFPQAEVWITQAEKDFALRAQPPAVLPSQVNSPAIKWHVYALQARPYGPFRASLDLFGDGSAVLVPLPGHTPGSVGLVLTVASGKRYFFIGDAAWRAAGVEHEAPKPWMAQRVADHDRHGTLASVRFIHGVERANPGLTIVPAHDDSVHGALGYYPGWVE